MYGPVSAVKGKQSKALKNWMWDCSSLLRQKAMKVKLLNWCTQPWLEFVVDSSWNVVAHGDAREGKWSGNWRMESVASTYHTTSEHGVSSITTADVHTPLNWGPRRFKWTRPFRRKIKYGFCACAITFQLASTKINIHNLNYLATKWNGEPCLNTSRFKCVFVSLNLVFFSNMQAQ